MKDPRGYQKKIGFAARLKSFASLFVMTTTITPMQTTKNSIL
jgi:hypothetical protein